MKRLKLKIGDVFSIPISKTLVGYGQIVISGKVLYIIVFEETYQKADRINIEKIVSGKIFLVGYTLDGRLYHGMWKVVGNAPVSKNRIPFPRHKRGNSTDGFVVVDFNGQILHPASELEQELLTFKTTMAPIEYEIALQSKHGIHTWDREHDQLTIQSIRLRGC